MAKNFIKTSKHQTGRNITTKTPYGSTSDMIVTDEELLKKISIDENCILLQDDEGYYITNKNRIDTGLSDPLRYWQQYRQIISDKIANDIKQWDKNNE